tara:strand:+ start:275 stop:577 length:303 start_codon:yes stop_codon:yes gene_type:complete
MYKQDPNNSNKQVPKSPDFSETYNEATTPAVQTLAEKPNEIIINKAGTYVFAYQSGSIATYTTGSILTADGPITLPIQPVAWDGTANETGNVTFIYKRVR